MSSSAFKFIAVFGSFSSLFISITGWAIHPAIDCYRTATSPYELRLSDADASILCRGAESDAPIDCFRKTLPLAGLRMETRNAVILCQGARSMEPIYCFKESMPMGGTRIPEHSAALLCQER